MCCQTICRAIQRCSPLLLVCGFLLAEEGDDFLKQAEHEEKLEQSGLSEEDIELAKKYRTNVYLLGIRRSNVLKHLLMTDEQLWDWLPHAVNGKVLLRTGPGHGYGRGCPIHGKYKGDVRRTWNWSPDRPYKVQCRTGEEWLPTNDYGAYVKAGRKEKLDLNKKHVDDGYGVKVGGKRYWCAGAASYFLYSYIIQLRSDLVSCWKSSGSEVFLRKAMIVWASIARDYPLMNYGRQNVGAHPSWWLGKMTCWGHYDINLANDFNNRKMWEAATADQKLKKFLVAKGITGDPKKYIFKNIMMELYDACLKKNWFLSQGIGGAKFQHIVKWWDNNDPVLGPTNHALTRQADGILWRHLYNDMYRDGINTEVAASYGLMSQDQAAKTIRERMKQGKPFPRTPRLRNILCGSVRLIVIDKFLPSIGDSPFVPYTPHKGRGSAMTGALARGGKGTGEPASLQLGYEIFKGAMTAKWLHQTGRAGKHAAIGKLVAKEGDDLALGSRALTGYGLGILESGDRGRRRAVTLFWGPGGVGSHAHSDMLNIELFAFGKTLAPDLGYPEETGTPKKRQAWTSATVSHSTVAVDRRSTSRVFGTLNCFKTFPGFHTLDVSAEQARFGSARPPERIFRRQLALVDVDKDRFYVIDVFRIRGGSQHDWFFHASHKEPPGQVGPAKPDIPETEPADQDGAEDEADKLLEQDGQEKVKAAPKEMPADFIRRVPVETNGLELSDPGQWHLLSEYQKSIGRNFNGTQYLHYPQFAEPTGPWNITWDTGDRVKVRLTMLKGAAQRVILADGEPPRRKGAPKFLKYVLARNEGENLESNYTGFIEAYRDSPAIRSVTDLRTEDSLWSDVAVKVELNDRTDYFFSSLNSEELHRYPAGIQFRGSQAFVSSKGGRLEMATLIGGAHAAKSTAALEAFDTRIDFAAGIGGRVESTDPAKGTFLTRSDSIHPGLIRETMILGNASHKCAYRITGLKRQHDGVWQVNLEADFIVGISPLKGIKDRTALLAERITTYTGHFKGMTLTNESNTSHWRIASSKMTEVTVVPDGPGLDAAAVKDVDGDLERSLVVCDFGPGDEWSVAAAACMTQSREGYLILANSPAKVTLPDGARLSVKKADGTIELLKPTETRGARKVFQTH